MTHTTRDRPAEALSDRPVADLVKLATEQLTTLVRDEFRLARAELAEKGRHAGKGIGMFGGAGIVALYGVGALIATIVLGLAEAMPAWLAALIVAVVLLAVAGVLAIFGRTQVRRAAPPVPSDAVSSIRSDLHTVTDAVKERGQR